MTTRLTLNNSNMFSLPSWSVTLTLIATVVTLLYVRLRLVNTYWRKRGVPCAKTQAFFGSTRQLFFVGESIPEAYDRIYNELEGHSFGGYYIMMKPVMMLREPQLIRRILVEDFRYFHDRGFRTNKIKDPMTQHLYALDGELWRELRAQLSTAFSPSKTRRMFFLVEECCARMLRVLAEPTSGAPYRDVEFKEALSRFTTDVIGACAFGVECGAIYDANSQFRQIAKKAFEISSSDAFRKFVVFYMDGLADYLRIRAYSSDIEEFFKRLFKETVEYRHKTELQRDDFIHQLMQLKKRGLWRAADGTKTQERSEIPNEVLISNSFMTFTLAFEMTSSSMAFCLFELAFHPTVQNKVRREVDAALRRHGGQLTIEGVQEMSYLDKVIRETLRLYPPMSFLHRQCTVPYTMPGGTFVLDQHTWVTVPVFSLHRDPRNFPEPLEFRPERFTDEIARAATHPAYMPFGDGPRSCIGEVFALVQMKAGLAALLSRYEVRQSPRTTSRPAPIERRKIFTCPAGGLWLRISPRSWLPSE